MLISRPHILTLKGEMKKRDEEEEMQ